MHACAYACSSSSKAQWPGPQGAWPSGRAQWSLRSHFGSSHFGSRVLARDCLCVAAFTPLWHPLQWPVVHDRARPGCWLRRTPRRRCTCGTPIVVQCQQQRRRHRAIGPASCRLQLRPARGRSLGPPVSLLRGTRHPVQRWTRVCAAGHPRWHARGAVPQRPRNGRRRSGSDGDLWQCGKVPSGMC